MSSAASSLVMASPTSGADDLNSGGSGQQNQGISIGSFLASLAAGLAIFGVELCIFLIVNGKLTRIYQPRTFLVPERERTKPPPKGLWQWLYPVFHTTNTEFIQKCGLDAYFFLRYLRTLLKIFIPLACLILPILITLNAAGGRGSAFATGQFQYQKSYTNVTGLDQLAWGNVRPDRNNRYWAHLVLALIVIFYSCFVFFDELRSYIRLRQAYLTSPQHRLRASATTVLVTAIPTKWCTFEALDGLYDVFPGGIRNIWINRNFDELNDKVKMRKKIASALESAETNLIKNAKQEQMKRSKDEAKRAGKKSSNTKDGKNGKNPGNESSLAGAQTDGISSGDPHQTHHTIDEEMDEASREHSPDRSKPLVPVAVIGQGIDVVGHGLETVGKTVLGGFKKAGKDIDDRLNTTGGFIAPSPETDLDRGRSTEQKLVPRAPENEDRSASKGSGSHKGISAGAPAPFRIEHTSGSDDTTVRQSVSQNNSDHKIATRTQASNALGIDGAPLDARLDGELFGRDVVNNPERLGEADEGGKFSLKFWKQRQKTPFGIPSPTPHGHEEDEFPLSRPSPMTPGCNPPAVVNGKEGADEKAPVKSKKDKSKGKDDEEKTTYPTAIVEDYDPNEGDPKWKEYIKEKDRETMRLPIFGWQWMPSLPLMGEQVDTIDYCRQEIARLNLEIEEDQKKPEKYPIMNSAFVQFNHQVAAHMACQSVTHHTPQQMAPRVVEISPDDVIWDNMSIRWWEAYVRTGLIIVLVIAMIALWAVPVTFTGLLSNVTYLSRFSWLKWIARAPTWLLSIIQGILPQALLAGLMALLPITLRLLARLQGNYTGMSVELSVQTYYFSFLFVQIFLVVSISSGITTILPEIAKSPGSIPSLLAQNLPKASNYFFSYLLLQALSVSAGALMQIAGLFKWFILAALLDSTARQKFRRQIELPNMKWGTFFPVYTNLACIGLIYSVISPLMMIFNIITFSLFWLVYRYNTLYVTKFRFDTGGLLYPQAIHQLFTGLYFMELVMIGLFFLVRDYKVDADGHAFANGSACKTQAIIMIVVMILTAVYQFLLHQAFSPLIRYLPITLEDEAVMRDEEFARAQEKRWALEDNTGEDTEQEVDEDPEFRQGRRSPTPNRAPEEIEMQNMKSGKEYGRLDPRNITGAVGGAVGKLVPARISWADRSKDRGDRSPNLPQTPANEMPVRQRQRHRHRYPVQKQKHTDMEAQRLGSNALAEALFAGIHDEIEDLTPDERDRLVQRAFQHEALRARRPVIWIPRDDLGVSDDEIRRTQKLSEHIWISNEYTGLDKNGKVIFRKSPPDFSELDLIEL